MKKKKVLAVLVALLVLVGAGVYTYSRYVYTKSGSGSKGVATWAVVLKQGGNAVTDDFDLALTLASNDNVVNGKIAPSRSATATLVLDLTGTEVATDIEVDLSSVDNLPDGMSITGVTANGNAMTAAAGVYSTMIALNAGKTAISANAVELVITASWVNDENNNANDTTFGNAHGTLTIPVTVTAKQHIGAVAASSVWTLPQGKNANNLTVGDEICVSDQCFNFIKYDGTNNEDVVMLAKYNLNVGNSAKGTETFLQDSDVRGMAEDMDSYGNVAFAYSGYWSGSVSSYPANVYSTDYVSVPNFAYNTTGYSIAYYVEQYKTKLINDYNATIKSARLLTYAEATDQSIGCTFAEEYDEENPDCPTNTFITNTSFWLGTAGSTTSVYDIYTDGDMILDECDFDNGSVGVRPVVVVAKANL